jgi:hypothetical protein
VRGEPVSNDFIVELKEESKGIEEQADRWLHLFEGEKS